MYYIKYFDIHTFLLCYNDDRFPFKYSQIATVVYARHFLTESVSVKIGFSGRFSMFGYYPKPPEPPDLNGTSSIPSKISIQEFYNSPIRSIFYLAIYKALLKIDPRIENFMPKLIYTKNFRLFW